MRNWDDTALFGSIRPSDAIFMRRDAAGKRSGPIEAVLAWAYREELPKAPRIQNGPSDMMSGWSKTARYGEYLSLVELHGVNEYGCVPDFSAQAWPCPDAKIIADAVRDLDGCQIEMPEDWNPAPELDVFGGLGVKAVSEAWRRLTITDANGHRSLRVKPSDLIVRRAVMGWDLDGLALDQVTQEFVKAANGRERWFLAKLVDTVIGTALDGSDITRPETIEVEGWSARQRRPLAGAYRKPFLDPDPVITIMARAEHEIWVAALGLVHDAVAARLDEIAVLPCSVPVEPWRQEQPRARLMRDLAADAKLVAEDEERRLTALSARFPRWFKREVRKDA